MRRADNWLSELMVGMARGTTVSRLHRIFFGLSLEKIISFNAVILDAQKNTSDIEHVDDANRIDDVNKWTEKSNNSFFFGSRKTPYAFTAIAPSFF